ncbi:MULTISPECIES: LysR family transcriptional regulator [Methylotenera]|uniref:LysR family transcriptional regulator n=1 Tax=Methylotenera TaxID=359407 RepID=UPI0003786E27|nr:MULTISPECIES: LysR family transcriptional regulator [Methylotenera]
MQNQLEMLRIFKVVAESANFREASVRLAISPQSVTRAIKELEELLGEPLFYRSTRNTTITEFGKQMALKSEGVIEQVDALFESKKSLNPQAVEGLVKITMPNSFGQQYLLPALTDFLKSHPGIQFDLRFSNLIDNVVADQMDIGVRVGFFSNNRNVARRVNELKFYIVGTPELIAKTGVPQKIEALFQMPYTGLIDQNTGRMWPWNFADAPDFVPISPAFITDDPNAELDAVLAGIGYGQIADFLCAKYLHSGELVSVLQDQSPTPWGIYVYRPQRGPVAERVRVVFDYLVNVLSDVKLF